MMENQSQVQIPPAATGPEYQMPTPPTSLDAVAVGATARVIDIGGDDAVAIRLLEMGLTPGVLITVLGRAPFGDPLELGLRGYRLSIRLAEASRVTIERA